MGKSLLAFFAVKFLRFWEERKSRIQEYSFPSTSSPFQLNPFYFLLPNVRKFMFTFPLFFIQILPTKQNLSVCYLDTYLKCHMSIRVVSCRIQHDTYDLFGRKDLEGNERKRKEFVSFQCLVLKKFSERKCKELKGNTL